MRFRSSTALVCALLVACAGFRGGWASLPYIGSEPPRFDQPPTPAETWQRSEFALPGLTLGVNLNNQLRTYDTQVYFLALPLSIDPRNVYQQPIKPGVTRVTLRVAPTIGSLVLRHALARLSIGGKSVNAAVAHEFGMWAANGEPLSSGGKYDYKPILADLLLNDVGRQRILSLEFPVDRPSPESAGVSLDLSEALSSPEVPTIPLIRFVPVRWEEGYT